MIPLVVTEDRNGRVMNGLRQPSSVDILVLTAHTGATLTVPTGAEHVLFSSTTNFYTKYTSDAITSSVYAESTVTAGGVCSGTAAELNPTLRTLTSVTGLGIIAPANGYLTMSGFG